MTVLAMIAIVMITVLPLVVSIAAGYFLLTAVLAGLSNLAVPLEGAQPASVPSIAEYRQRTKRATGDLVEFEHAA